MIKDLELDRLGKAKREALDVKHRAKEKCENIFYDMTLYKTIFNKRINFLDQLYNENQGKMIVSFRKSKRAYKKKDFVGANMHSKNAHSLKTINEDLMKEKQMLMDEIKSLEADYLKACDEFSEAKNTHIKAIKAFGDRLEFIKSSNIRFSSRKGATNPVT